MRCTNPGCEKKSFVLEDHRIASKNCLLTTRAAKWATVQVGGGRTVSAVATELASPRGPSFVGEAQEPLPGSRHAARDPRGGTHDQGLVRQDLQLPPRADPNGPTEALNNLVKRIKRIGVGSRNFGNY